MDNSAHKSEKEKTSWRESDVSNEVSKEDLEEDEGEEELAFAEKCLPNCDMNMCDHLLIQKESRQDNVDEANEKS